jgi:hypothetical protein
MKCSEQNVTDVFGWTLIKVQVASTDVLINKPCGARSRRKMVDQSTGHWGRLQSVLIPWETDESHRSRFPNAQAFCELRMHQNQSRYTVERGLA